MFAIPISRKSKFNFIQFFGFFLNEHEIDMEFHKAVLHWRALEKGLSIASSWNLLTEIEKSLLFLSKPIKTCLFQQKPALVLKTTAMTCSHFSSVLQSWLFPLSKVNLDISSFAFFSKLVLTSVWFVHYNFTRKKQLLYADDVLKEIPV